MAFKIFLDANVLLDLTLKRDFYSEAKQLMQMVIDNKAKAFVTPSIIHTVGYWLTKHYSDKQAKGLLLTLLDDISIVDISHEIVLIALHSKMDDIEDALQYYSAIHHKIDYFISRDKQLKKDSVTVLPVYTPTEFIAIFY